MDIYIYITREIKVKVYGSLKQFYAHGNPDFENFLTTCLINVIVSSSYYLQKAAKLFY